MASVFHSASLPQISLDLSTVHRVVEHIESFSPGTSPKKPHYPSPRTESINQNKYLSIMRIWDKEIVVYHTTEKNIIRDCYKLRYKDNLVHNKFTPLNDEEYFDRTNKYLVCLVRKLKKGTDVNDYEHLIKKPSSTIIKRPRSNSTPIINNNNKNMTSFDKKGYKVLGFILYRKNYTRKTVRILDIVFIKNPDFFNEKFPELKNFPISSHCVSHLEHFLKKVGYNIIFRSEIKSPRLNSIINDSY